MQAKPRKGARRARHTRGRTCTRHPPLDHHLDDHASIADSFLGEGIVATNERPTAPRGSIDAAAPMQSMNGRDRWTWPVVHTSQKIKVIIRCMMAWVSPVLLPSASAYFEVASEKLSLLINFAWDQWTSTAPYCPSTDPSIFCAPSVHGRTKGQQYDMTPRTRHKEISNLRASIGSLPASQTVPSFGFKPTVINPICCIHHIPNRRIPIPE